MADYTGQTIGLAPMSLKQDSGTLPANSSFTFTGVALAETVHVYGEFIPRGAEVNPIGTIDPDNTSTGDANMINDNLTDLVYNNSSAGSANKSLPAIDLGSPQAIAEIDVYWWNATYWATSFRIEGSNDGTTWSDVSGAVAGVFVASGTPQVVGVSGTWRYYRFFCITGNNATWCVLSELRAYLPASSTEIRSLYTEPGFTIIETAGQVEVQNNTSTSVEITISYLQ